MKKILIVEDDVNINNLLKSALKPEYDCVQAFSGTEAILLINNDRFDLMLLDLMLPGATGQEVLQRVRQAGSMPVIILTAIDELDSKIDLLKLGADDYITKPFEIEELKVRVMASLRRSGNDSAGCGDIVQFGELTLNKRDYSLYIGNNQVMLTRQEFRILDLLISNKGKVFTKQAIYDYAWDDYYVGADKTINVHISNIRGKLKKFTDREYIETVWGIGYKLAQ